VHASPAPWAFSAIRQLDQRRQGRVRAPSVNTAQGGFDALVKEHYAALLAAARRLTASPADAQDLVQDVAERALKAFDQLPAGSNVRGWLFTILNHAFIDRCRRKKLENVQPLTAEDAEVVSAPTAEEKGRWESVSVDQVAQAVKQLPEDFRRVYAMHSLEGKSYAEIAQTLGVPKATVGTRLIRARRRLRDLLIPEGVTDGPA
jgi:RNA polymerase sigma-70 factor, ECF subfamily